MRYFFYYSNWSPKGIWLSAHTVHGCGYLCKGVWLWNEIPHASVLKWSLLRVQPNMQSFTYQAAAPVVPSHVADLCDWARGDTTLADTREHSSNLVTFEHTVSPTDRIICKVQCLWKWSIWLYSHNIFVLYSYNAGVFACLLVDIVKQTELWMQTWLFGRRQSSSISLSSSWLFYSPCVTSKMSCD